MEDAIKYNQIWIRQPCDMPHTTLFQASFPSASTRPQTLPKESKEEGRDSRLLWVILKEQNWPGGDKQENKGNHPSSEGESFPPSLWSR